MTNAMIDLNILPLETLAEMANEKAAQVERSAKKTVADAMDCGRYLEAAKEQVLPGKWLEWLGQNWNYSRRTAATYISLADHGKHFPSIEYQSIREAMKMIADEKAESEPEPIAPRAERKTGQVEVVEPEQVGQTVVQADDDPTPDPPTQRKTAAGSEKVSEDKKPRTQQVVAEILPDEPDKPPQKHWPEVSLKDLVEGVIAQLEHDKQRKEAAKTLRKLADKLDPPTKFVKPDIDDVSAYMHTLGDAVGKDVSSAAEGFIDHYESNGWMVGKVPMKDWQATARKWLKNQGQFTGGNGNGQRTAATGQSHSRPPVERAKYNYK